MTTTARPEEEATTSPLTDDPPPADLDALRARMSGLEQQANALIRERPVAAVLAAVGVGYLVARVVSRGSR